MDTFSIKAPAGHHACNCVGRRNDEPLCPCAMRGVVIRDGRYVLPERDLGPVSRVEGKRFDNLLKEMDGLIGVGRVLLERHR